MKRNVIRVLCLALALCMIFVAAGCGKSKDEAQKTEGPNPRVLVTMEDGSTFTIELYPEYAPETCENFLKLVKSGFYNGLTFHRVIEGFMAQGGDPEGTGMGGSPDKIHGEFPDNGFDQNTLKHERGTVSMARADGNMDSASSQFFICYENCANLDGGYAAFGKVIEGMETVDNFLKIPRTMGLDGGLSKPERAIVMEKLEVVA